MSKVVRALQTLLMASCLWAAPISILAATLPSGFAETQVASGLTSPTSMAATPDGRLLICQQAGELRIFKAGSLLATPFVVVPTEALAERGLVGVAVDPGFATNRFIYVNYTASTTPRHNVVVRYTASESNPDIAEAGSEVVLFDCDNHNATVHVGGGMAFGTDGMLYIAHGESGSGAGPQQLTTLYGKLLRISPDGSIPSSNPFYNSATGKYRAIYAYGFRNPFSFAFQAGTGRFFVNDVGQQTYEEIDSVVGGGNYGWPNAEGPSGSGYIDPIYAYGHGDGIVLGKSITGATFYQPAINSFPAAYQGMYFFGDYVNGWINVLDPSNNAVDSFRGVEANLGIVDLDVVADGSLYVLARGATPTAGSGVGYSTGVIRKIEYTGSLVPTITVPPADETAVVNHPATFRVTASGTPPLSYQWMRNDSDLPGATGTDYTTPDTTLGDDGVQFRCRVSNAQGSITSVVAKLTISTNQLPTPVIRAPAAGDTYNAGDVLAFDGTAADTEDGALPASGFSWRIDLHHDTHTHPALPVTSGVTNGTYAIPVNIEVSDNVWYRVYLFVTDSQGATASTYRDVLPNKVALTLNTVPAGLPLLLDSQPVKSSLTVTGVVGVLRSLGAAATVTNGGTVYQFVSWSDGGAASHIVSTPSSPATYTATFKAQPTNSPPVPTWISPAADATYSAGDTLGYSARATDAEDGELPAGAFTWRIDFVHSNEVDTVFGPTGGNTGGSIPLPRDVDRAADAFYRVILSVADTAGSTVTVSRDVLPNTSTFSLRTEPAGLAALILDGAAVPSGIAITGVVGITRSLGVFTAVTNAGVAYRFAGWSDGGAASHTIGTPASPTTFTATFAAVSNSPPVARIVAPLPGSTYTAGQTFQFQGEATDAQDGVLGPAQFAWRVDYHHSGKVDYAMGITGGITNGSVLTATNTDTDPGAFYRVQLAVTDLGGLVNTAYRDITPNLSGFVLETQPSGLNALLLDGAPVLGGSQQTGVVGVSRTLGIVSPVTNAARIYEFVSWSDGGESSHAIATPPLSTAYTALFREIVSNTPPVATLLSPAANSTYSAGDPLPYSGSATDEQDGILPASAFTWRIEFHHSGQSETVFGPISGHTSGAFPTPQSVDPDPLAFYRVLLSAIDASNVVVTASRDVLPNTATFTLQTDPPGMWALLLDGVPVGPGTTKSGVVGVSRSVSVTTPQTNGSKTYEFVSWSDGGAASHSINTPASATTYTANFRELVVAQGALTLATDPPGLPLLVDGQPVTTPVTISGAAGSTRGISASPSSATSSNTYAFVSWSDQETDRTRNLTLTTSTQSLTAIYQAASDGVVIVNWGGDYLATDASLRGSDTPEEPGLDLDGDGNADDCRWYCPYSDADPLAPPGSSGGVSWKFYGGELMHRYKAAGFEYHWAEIWTWSSFQPADVLHSLGPARSHGWDLRYWKREDFLSGASNAVVRFGPSSTLELIDYAGGDARPEQNSGRVRFVVRDAAQFFISEDFGAGSNSLASFLLTDPGSHRWAPYSPAPPHRIQFKVSDASFKTHAFTNVTAVGYLHSNDNVPSPGALIQPGFTLGRVRITAELSKGQTVPTPTLKLRVLPGNGRLVLSLTSVAGTSYTLLGSDNMKDWQPLQTLVGSGGVAEFEIDPRTGSPTLFFQLRVDE